MFILPYLKHTDEGLREVIEVAASWSVVAEVKFPPKHLHAQERENYNEEEEKKEQGSDGAHRVEEGGHKITQRLPVPAKSWKMVMLNGIKSYNLLRKRNNLKRGA